MSEHVQTKLQTWRFDGEADRWVAEGGRGALAPVGEDISVSAVWPDDSDEVWVTRTGFLVPTTLERGSAADGLLEGKTREAIKAMPSFFDASGLECKQHFASSADGTKVTGCCMRALDDVMMRPRGCMRV